MSTLTNGEEQNLGVANRLLSPACEDNLGWVYPFPPESGIITLPPVYTQEGVTQLIVGQSYIDVVFGSTQIDNQWVLVECVVVNTVDGSPLNIWPGIMTSKLTTGFRLYLNGMPDSSNYYLHWAVSGVNIMASPATTYLLSGPTSGGFGVATTFTVRLPMNTTIPGVLTVTPSDGGAGGVFSPVSVTLSTTSASATFTYTPILPGYHRSLTVDHTKVPSTQTDFPVLVSITDATLKTVANGGHVIRTDGFDIGFYSDSALTTKLKWEIEKYDPTTGELVAWVKIASLSSSEDTVFYMRYGDSTVTTDQSDPVNVWSSGYISVYHLGNNGVTLNVSDALGANNGTNVGGVGVSSGGMVDGAGDFAGTVHYINLGHNASFNLGGDYTFSAWFFCSVLPTTPDSEWLVGKDTNTGRSFAFGLTNFGPSNKLTFQAAGAVVVNGGTVLSAATAYYATLTKNSGTTTVYLNGVSDGSAASGTIPNSSTDCLIGSRGYPGFEGPWVGWIDEVHFTSVGRSAGWILTEYNNQFAPGTFITLGPEAGSGSTLAPLPGSATATQLLNSAPMTRAAIASLAPSTGNYFDSQSFDPCILVDPTDSNKLIMFFSGMASPVATGAQTIGRATASITAPSIWTVSGSPVLTPTLAWETGGDGLRADSVLYNPVDSKIYLFYTAKTGTSGVGVATSSDLGLTWTKLGQAIVPTGTETYLSQMAVLMEGTTLHGIYAYRTGVLTLPAYRYASATTANWLSWTKGGVDVYSDPSPGRFHEFHHLLKVGSTYLLCYESGSTTVPYDIRFASSSSPSTGWTIGPIVPFLQKSGVVGTFDRYHTATGHVRVINGFWYIVYCGALNHDQPYGTNHWQMGIVPLGS